MAATVTVDKAYFETLLRRADLVSFKFCSIQEELQLLIKHVQRVSSKDFITPLDLPTVSIPKVDHDNLLRIAQEYSSLKASLYQGGIAAGTLELLIRGDTTSNEEAHGGSKPFNHPIRSSSLCSPWTERECDSVAGVVWSPKPYSFTNQQKDRRSSYVRRWESGQDDGSFPSDFDREDQASTTARSEKQQYARAEQRTIMARSLPDQVTHRDIVEIIRGGALLDVFLRPHERSASISFVEGSAAQSFMNYVKRNDIYVHGKRIEFTWSDRQFVLPGHVASKIGIGATRNVVIRGVRPDITEERLRDDLDHIHNLIVINVLFQHDDAYLSLNSIHNSMFARTCLMSRGTYKGMRIEWYPDECAQPLPKVEYPPRKETISLLAKKLNPIANRFQMLSLGGTEDGSEDDGSNEGTSANPSSLSTFLPTNHRSPWNARTAVV